MRTLFISMLMLLVLLPGILAGAENQPAQLSPPVFFPIRPTEIQATVLFSSVSAFPYAHLILSVGTSSDPTVLDCTRGPQEIEAVNYIIEVLGRPDFMDERNIGSISAFYLLQGDRIRAKLFVGSGPTNQWYVSDILRIVDLGPRLSQIANVQLGPKLESARMNDDVEFKVHVDHQAYKLGEPIPLTFSMKNTGKLPKAITFMSGKRYDFVVTQAGREVWRWSARKMFTQHVSGMSLAPGEAMTFKETWPQTDSDGRKVSPGEYKITAVPAAKEFSHVVVDTIAVKINPQENQ